MKRGRKYKKVIQDTKDAKAPKTLEEAIEQVKNNSTSKFAGSVELHVATKSKEKEYMVRGTVSLPHSFGKSKKVLVFCEDKDADKAKKAGADYAGLTDLIKQIQDGFDEFDVVLATPQVMAQIAILGKQLGPKGLMPNPKAGTLINDFDAIESFKAGKISFKMDASGVVHVSLGKTDMDTKKLVENAKALLEAIREAANKNKAQIKSIHLAPTMGPSVSLPVSAA